MLEVVQPSVELVERGLGKIKIKMKSKVLTHLNIRTHISGLLYRWFYFVFVGLDLDTCFVVSLAWMVLGSKGPKGVTCTSWSTDSVELLAATVWYRRLGLIISEFRCGCWH